MNTWNLCLLAAGILAACGPQPAPEAPPPLGTTGAEVPSPPPATATASTPPATAPPAEPSAPEPQGTRLELYPVDDVDCPKDLTFSKAVATMPEGLKIELGNVHLVKYKGDVAVVARWFEGLKIPGRALAMSQSGFFEASWMGMCRMTIPTISAADFATLTGAPGPEGSNQTVLEATLKQSGNDKIGKVAAGVKRFIWVYDGMEALGVLFLKPLKNNPGASITIVLNRKPEQLAGGPPIQWAK
ncbi:MAG: hypothetical protein JRI68_13330 [Deltaproteobacteria bacterium]|nr:hypothetical protein [Deltaproteobacteria bacterium]